MVSEPEKRMIYENLSTPLVLAKIDIFIINVNEQSFLKLINLKKEY